MPVLAGAVAAPLARPSLLGFLDLGAIPVGIESAGFRLGALMVAAMSLHAYSDLVRGPDRPVLDPHPVQARPLVRALMVGTVRERLYLPIVAATVLLPVAVAGHTTAWLGAVGLVLGGWLCGLGLGYAVNLGGVWAARSPRFQVVLDLIRGHNPRSQAAFIYAPAVALGLGGLAVGFAAAGVRAALEGWAPGWAFLGLPPALGAVGLWLSGPLADRNYVLATWLLAEVEGTYAAVEKAEDTRAVYLEWAARDRETRRALRQGWRRLRSFATGGWLLGAVGLLAGWSDEPAALARVIQVAGGAVVLLGALPARLADGDPEWLDLWLGVGRARVARGRAVATLLYQQGVVLLPVLALLLRQGLGPALTALVTLEALAVLSAALGAALASRWRGRAIWSYGPLALILWAASAALFV